MSRRNPVLTLTCQSIFPKPWRLQILLVRPFHTHAVIYYWPFRECLALFSMMSSKVICCVMCWFCVPWVEWVISHCMDIQHFVYPLTCRWTFEFVEHFNYYNARKALVFLFVHCLGLPCLLTVYLGVKFLGNCLKLLVFWNNCSGKFTLANPSRCHYLFSCWWRAWETGMIEGEPRLWAFRWAWNVCGIYIGRLSQCRYNSGSDLMGKFTQEPTEYTFMASSLLPLAGKVKEDSRIDNLNEKVGVDSVSGDNTSYFHRLYKGHSRMRERGEFRAVQSSAVVLSLVWSSLVGVQRQSFHTEQSSQKPREPSLN